MMQPAPITTTDRAVIQALGQVRSDDDGARRFLGQLQDLQAMTPAVRLLCDQMRWAFRDQIPADVPMRYRPR